MADLSYAYEYDLIEFEIDVYKDERSAQVKMYLEITQGMPPNIDPDLCVSNCKVIMVLCALFRLTSSDFSLTRVT